MAHVPVPVIDKAGWSVILDGDPDPQAEIEPPASSPMKHRPPIIIRWTANGGYAILLVTMAVLPSTLTTVGSSVPDWLSHAVAYGIQMALVYWAALPSLGHRRSLAVGVVAAGAFGGVTECLQFLQPSRTVELTDIVANTVGALAACGVIVAFDRKSARRVF